MRARSWRDVGAGLVTASAALAAQWAVHVAAPGAPFAPYAVAEWAIVHAPGTVATDAIESLGPWARRLAATAAVTGALAAGGGVARVRPGLVALAAVAATLGAAALDPQAVTLVGALLSAAAGGSAALVVATLLEVREDHTDADPLRRRLLVGALVGAGALVVGGVALRRLLASADDDALRADAAADVPFDPQFSTIPGLTPAVTSRGDHYVVDINLDSPRIDASSWRLRVGGLVEQPLALSLDELRAMRTVEELAMLSCISNQVGGGLTGNARWTGVPLSTLLGGARPVGRPAAVRFSAADGYEDTMPFERATGPEVIVAIAMDGELLPIEHGFPARLLVPGLYGMKNVKWLTDITLLETDAPGYWEERGWDTRADVRTESRFDIPHDHDEVAADVVAAGVAWAGTRRISRVEVSTDDGATWSTATLEAELSPWSWRRWMAPLHLRPGPHALAVRAYDGAGIAEDSQRRSPHPSGASGYHRITVTVAA